MTPTQSYKEDYTSIRIFLIIILCVEFCGFSFFYYSQYKQNSYNFFQSYQQEAERIKIDSINKISQLNKEIIKLNSARQEREAAYLEMRYISRIINILTNGDTPRDTISIENTNSYIKIHQLSDDQKENDTLFIIHEIGPTRHTHVVKLKLKHYGWSKFGDKLATNEKDNILKKLNEQEKLVRNDLVQLRNSEFVYSERVNYLTEEIKYIKRGSLDIIDFFIFTGNIHTSLGFNGIIPASSKMRLWCLVHKIIVIILYYFLYTKFKTQKD